jgi:signal transduction histidine kinase
LVTDLGAVAKLADGSIRLRRRRTDLTALVTRVVDEADGFENRVLLLDGEPVNLSVDAARLEQIVDSLLTNARSRTTKGQTIRIHVRGADDGGVSISVDDDGRGDPAIGPELSLAVRLAELHGGRLWLEPLSKGASFRVELPGAARSAAHGATSA